MSDIETLGDALTRAGVSVCEAPDTDDRAVVRFVHDGQRYAVYAETPATVDEPHFSGRELEIARLISRGHTTRTVAAVLEISPWTVTTYVRRMFAKLDVASRSALVARCAALGMLDVAAEPERTPR